MLLDSMFMIILGLEYFSSSICVIVRQKERRHPWLYLVFKSQEFPIMSLKIEIFFEHSFGIIYLKSFVIQLVGIFEYFMIP